MKKPGKRVRQFSLLALLVLIVVIFLTVVTLLYQYLHHFQRNNGRGVGQQNYNNLKRLIPNDMKLDNNKGSRNSKDRLWLVQEKNGVYLLQNPSKGSTTLSFIPLGTLLIGNEVVRVDADEDTSLYLNVKFPSKGWLFLSSWNFLKMTELSLEKSQAIPVHYGRKKQTPQAPQNKRDSSILCSDNSIYQPGFDYVGNDLTDGIENPIKANTVQDCCQECLKNRLCYSWSYTNENDCWLKGNPSSPPNPNPQISAGKLPNSPRFPRGATEGRSSSSGAFPAELMRPDQLCCNKSAIEFTPIEMPIFVLDNIKQLQVAPEKIIFQSVSIFDKERILPSSSYQLRTLLLTGNWDEQWPIGNGLFGGFVTGPLQYEVNPFSISDFFLLKSVDPPAPDQPQEKFTFQEARKEFLTGHFQKSDKILSSFQKHHRLGMFQHLFDLTTFFSVFPLEFHSFPEEEKPVISKVNPTIPVKLAPKRRFIPRFNQFMQFPGRRGRIERIRQHVKQVLPDRITLKQDEHIENEPNQPLKPDFIPFTNFSLSESKIDLASGLVFSSFIHHYRHSATSQESVNQNDFFSDDYHYREWFASEEDNLIVGKYKCHSLIHSEEPARHCLNLGVEISREVNFEKLILQLLHVEPASKYFSSSSSSSKSFPIGLLKSELIERSYVLNFLLQSNSQNAIPFTNILILLYCDGNEFLYQNNDRKDTIPPNPDSPSDSIHLFLCNSADEFSIFITVDKVDGMGKSREELINLNNQIISLPKNSPDSLIYKSDNTFSKAFQKGFTEVREAHEKFFRKRMLKTSLEFLPRRGSVEDENPIELCENFPDNIYQFHLFGKDCLQKEAAKALFSSRKLEFSSISSLFQYGRYLLFSSASRSVTNLQGIWSDGLSSAWNGDYHLNINLQMNYWAMMSVGSKEMIYPLLDFLEKLSIQGKQR
jgi:hypothetical protein